MAFDINIDTSKALGKIKTVNASLDVMAAKIVKLNTKGLALGAVGQKAAALKGSAGTGSVALQDLSRSMSQLKAMSYTTNEGITGVSKQISTFGAQTAKSGKNLKQFRQNMNHTAKEAAALRAGMYATGTHFGAFTAQTILAATATYMLVRAFVAVVQTGAEFEQSMARANAVMGNTGMGEAAERAATLEQEVRRLGESTVFTVNEVAGGLVFLGMAGLNTAEATKALEPVLNIASIGMIEMARAADIATNIMLGFDKGAKDLVDIVDIMAVAITSSNMDMEQLGNSLSYVAPVATATNNSLKDTVATLELFHNVGIKSSRAGTSLRRAMINLSKPTEKVSAVLTRLGVTLFDQQNKMKPLVNIMRQFVKAQASVSDITTIFGARAAPALLKFYSDLQKEVDGGTSSFQKFRNELDAAEGQADKIRDGIEDTLAADWKKLISAMSELSLQIFKDIVPGLRSMVAGVTEFVRAMNGEAIVEFAKGIAALITTVYLLEPVVIGAIALFSKMAAGATIASVAVKGLAASAAFLAGPVGIAILAVGALAYAASQYKSTVGKATDASEMHARKLAEEADAADKLKKLKEQLNELGREDLLIRAAAYASQNENASKAEALALRTQVASQSRLVELARQRSQISKDMVSGNLSSDEGTAQMSRNRFLTDMTAKQLAIATGELNVIREGLAPAKEKAKIAKDALDLSNAQVKATAEEVALIRQKARMTEDASGSTTIAKSKERAELLSREIDMQKALGNINSVEQSAAKASIYANELKFVNGELDTIIAHQENIVALAKSNAFDTEGLGTADAQRLTKKYTEEREALEKLQRQKINFERGTSKNIGAEEGKTLALGASVDDSLKSVWQKEKESYAVRLSALRKFHKEKDIVGKEASFAEAELTLKSGAAQVANAAQYVGQLVGMAAQASQRKYDISRKEAEKSYELWQTANDRQKEFRDAANNAQTAGDAQYYNNIANQYKAYASQYKKQFEERDAIARKNFESNKRMQIAQTRINTIAGAAMVLSQLGYWGIPIAAGMVKLGQDMVSDIKSQQYQSPGGGSSQFGGLPSAVDNTSSSNISDAPRSDGTSNALNIYIEGAITEDMINDVVIPAIQDGINERDIVLISGTGADSAQLSQVKGL